ncbi:MAG: dihydroxyacetone kinase phosphoryl donor subunit DhaM [Propionibacteriaceae bacterium]|nr:dihydroxyacetone kinase phosphoryl donor subunit DhaM [Propionibacteriaceae bacterium]
MIGIVVVSHSRPLAEAAVDLAREMAPEGPQVAVAAGIGDGFGTDAQAIAAAIEEVDSPDGVLVLLDLGSAILSAEMALEFIGEELASRVKVSAAPLVEGLVIAMVAGQTGLGLDQVEAEAAQGLLPKQVQLGVHG